MKFTKITITILAILTTILAKPQIFEVHSPADFKIRLDRFKGKQFHSRWIIFEAKWCPMSKKGITKMKKVLKKMEEDTVLFRVDW